MKDYKKILEGVMNIINTTEKSDIGFVNICAYIGENCPELKDSEDERIRKILIEAVKRDMVVGGTKDKQLAIAWLEKQGKKSVDKLKVSDELYEHIRNTCARIDDAYSTEYLADMIDYLSTAKRSAQSAFDMIEKQGEQIPANSAKTCKDDQKPTDKVEPKFKVGYWVVTDKCDTVQIRAVNNGYYTLYNGMIFNMSYVDKCWHRWTIADAKDGDVLACENGWICIFRCLNDNLFSSHCFMDDDGWFCEYGGQGHTLDNSICGEIHPATKEQRDLLFQKMSDAGYAFDFDKKEMMKIEQKPAENEELTEFDKAVGVSIGTWNPKSPEQIQSVKAVSKKLLKLAKKQINGEQKPAEWSKDDEQYLLICKNALSKYQVSDKWDAGIISRWLEERLKSIRPQKQWKPSDKQMEALEHFIRSITESGFVSPYDSNTKLVYSLLNDLKKLKL